MKFSVHTDAVGITGLTARDGRNFSILNNADAVVVCIGDKYFPVTGDGNAYRPVK